MWKALFLLIFVTATGGFVLWKGSNNEAPIPRHRLIRPKIGNITRGVIAIGRVEPRTRIEVKSKANGLIRKLFVDVNHHVTAGQIIAELDKEILEARVAEAEARVTQAQAALERQWALLQHSCI